METVAQPTNVFLSYSRKDAATAQRLLTSLEGRRVDAWVDWEDIPPSADWWREVCAAIEAADAFVFLMSPESVESAVCADEVVHALRHNKRLVAVVCRDVGVLPSRLDPLRRINWIFLRPSDPFETGVSLVMKAVDTDLDWVRAHTRLLKRAVEWEARGRDASFLLQRNDLTEAERWLARGPDEDPRPTALQTEYIIAGRAAATRQQRRLTAYALVAGVLIAAAAAAALVGFTRAERNARDALSRQLAAESRADVGVDGRSALARAVLALRTTPTREARSAVFGASYYIAGASRLLAGHEGIVTQSAFSPDGHLLATSGNDSTVLLWDVASGTPVRQLSGHRGGIARIVFSPDGRRLVSAGADSTAIIWDVATAKILSKLEGHDGVVVNIVISPDGTRLASVDDGSVQVWDMASGSRVQHLRNIPSAFSLAFSPDGRRIAASDENATVGLWDVASGKRMHRLVGHVDGFLPLASAAFFPGGQRLVTIAATDKDALVWDVESGRRVKRLRSHQAAIDGVAVSPDGRWIATASTEEGAVHIWDAGSGQRVHVLRGYLKTELIYTVLAFSADSRRLVTRIAADTAVLWEVESGTPLRRFRGHGKEMLTAALSGDGKWLATGGTDGSSILWDLTDSGPARRVQQVSKGISRGVFSPDSRWLAIEAGDRATLLDVANGNRVRDFVHPPGVSSVAFSADGKSMATGGGRDNPVRVWDVGRGEVLRRFAGYDDFVARIEFANDGGTLTTVTGPFARELTVWDLRAESSQASPIRRLPKSTIARGADVFDIAISSDGARYATTTLDEIPIIWDLRTGTEVHRLQGHHGEVQCVAFSRDGRWLGTGDREDVAIVWDAGTGKLWRRLLGHTDTINEIAFSSGGELIATASDDQTVILWDFATGAALHRFDQHTDSVEYVSLSPDGQRLLTSAQDGSLILLDIDVRSLVDRACRILDPGVSEEVWTRIVPGRPYPTSCRTLGRLPGAPQEP